MTSEEADRCGPPTHIWRNKYLKGVRFECRPIDQTPPDETLGFMYRSEGTSLLQSGVMIFRDGEWQKAKGCKVKGSPSHWVVMVDDAPEVAVG